MLKKDSQDDPNKHRGAKPVAFPPMLVKELFALLTILVAEANGWDWWTQFGYADVEGAKEIQDERKRRQEIISATWFRVNQLTSSLRAYLPPF